MSKPIRFRDKSGNKKYLLLALLIDFIMNFIITIVIVINMLLLLIYLVYITRSSGRVYESWQNTGYYTLITVKIAGPSGRI